MILNSFNWLICNFIKHKLSITFTCSLEKRVNKKVMAMFEKAEDEYNDLMSKKNIIEVGLTFSSDNLGLTLKAAYVNLLFSSAE